MTHERKPSRSKKTKGKRIKRVRDPHWHPHPPYDKLPDDAWIEVDTDEQWKQINELSEEHRIRYLCDSFPWEVIIDDLVESPVPRENFMIAFCTLEALCNRQKAVSGTAFDRNLFGDIIPAARAFHSHVMSIFPDHSGITNPSPLYVDFNDREWDSNQITWALSELLRNHDLEELARHLKNFANAEKTQKERKSVGIQPEKKDGLVWRAFCKIAISNRSLPTSVQLNDEIYRLDKSVICQSQLSKICQRLGIERKKATGKFQ